MVRRIWVAISRQYWPVGIFETYRLFQSDASRAARLSGISGSSISCCCRQGCQKGQFNRCWYLHLCYSLLLPFLCSDAMDKLGLYVAWALCNVKELSRTTFLIYSKRYCCRRMILTHGQSRKNPERFLCAECPCLFSWPHWEALDVQRLAFFNHAYSVQNIVWPKYCSRSLRQAR